MVTLAQRFVLISSAWGGGVLVDCVDLGIRDESLLVLPSCAHDVAQVCRRDFRDLDSNFLKQFDVVLFLAGHSSVGQAMNNQIETIDLNIRGFWDLVNKIDQAQLFIFASSGSVYDGYHDNYPNEAALLTSPRNMYDLSKMTEDFMSRFLKIKTIGLRFGTVSGRSDNFRPELILNKMTVDAVTSGVISLSNPESFRSLLGITDLSRAVMLLCEKRDHFLNNQQNSFTYNLANYSGMIQDIASQVAEITGAKIFQNSPSPTYDFSMDTTLFQKDFGFEYQQNFELMVQEIIDFNQSLTGN